MVRGLGAANATELAAYHAWCATHRDYKLHNHLFYGAVNIGVMPNLFDGSHYNLAVNFEAVQLLLQSLDQRGGRSAGQSGC